MDPTIRKLLPPQEPRPGVVYRPSQFAVQVDHRAWNTLTLQCLEVDLPESARAGEGWDDLIRSCFLVPEGKDECRTYEGLAAMLRVFHRKSEYGGFTVLPTLGCNARCVYCYEEGYKQVRMTPEIVEQTARYILAHHQGDGVRLVWFGGEPLLCTDIIDTITDRIAAEGLPYGAEMVSNGSLITPEIIERMAGQWHLQKIQISMDGCEADYIRRKRYYQYADTYHRVMENISRMSEAGIPVSIRCNVDPDNWDGTAELLADLQRNVSHKKNVSVHFVPLNAIRQSEDDLALWEKILAQRPQIEQAGFLPLRTMLLNNASFRTYHCMADAGAVAIAPDGMVYACEHCIPESRIGDIWHHVTEPETCKAFCRADHTREKCRKCPYLPCCTSFASCPVEDTHCREIRDIEAQYLVRSMSQAEEAQDPNLC